MRPLARLCSSWLGADSEAGTRAAAKAEGSKRQRGGGRLVPYEVTDTDGYSYVVLRKKARLPDPEEPIYTRIPAPPIPASWAGTVAPYQEPQELAEPVPHSRVIEADVLGYDLPSLGSFLAVLMDPPLQSRNDPPRPGWITPAQLAKLRFTKQLVPNGLVFVWVEKELIMDVVKQMRAWDFLYVENFVWVKKTVNNRFVTQPAPYFKKSKLSLHIFRKAVQETLELRHQRSPVRLLSAARPTHTPHSAATSIYAVSLADRRRRTFVSISCGTCRAGWRRSRTLSTR